MKQLIYTALTSLASGLAFAAGILAVILGWESFNSASSQLDTSGEWVNLPPNLTITEHARVPGAGKFTIRGTIQNEGEEPWFRVGVEATILAGGYEVNDCDTTIEGKTSPGESRAFQIECYKVAGDAPESAVTYTLAIPRAYTGG